MQSPFRPHRDCPKCPVHRAESRQPRKLSSPDRSCPSRGKWLIWGEGWCGRWSRIRDMVWASLARGADVVSRTEICAYYVSFSPGCMGAVPVAGLGIPADAESRPIRRPDPPVHAALLRRAVGCAANQTSGRRTNGLHRPPGQQGALRPKGHSGNSPTVSAAIGTPAGARDAQPAQRSFGGGSDEPRSFNPLSIRYL